MKRAFVTGGSGFLGGALIQALRERGIEVVALARSDDAAAKVVALGAKASRGDLDSVNVEDLRGCDVVFHSAALTKEHGTLAEHRKVNVEGTRAIVEAAQRAGVSRFVHVSTEAVLADGHPILRADENVPYPARPAGPYPISKGEAERIVLAANRTGFATVIIRPRFIWGVGDTSLLPQIAEAVEHGKFAWIGGGRYPTSTCNVANAVEGALLAAERGAPGEIYFLTDGAPVEFRAFLTKLLATRGVTARERTVPKWVARLVAATTAWMRTPPVTKTAIALVGHEVTVVDDKARAQLGYASRVSIDEGLARMQTPSVSS
ncbi:MAG TPA: NAD-dependent epimerase/dehydratase family protein [Kofleriaceae bacterium]